MGKPIIHSIEDALTVLYTTGLDRAVIDHCIISK
jgi:predicted NodU family carbamoyl transferase